MEFITFRAHEDRREAGGNFGKEPRRRAESAHGARQGANPDLLPAWHMVGQLVVLECAHFDFPTTLLTVRRSKNGLDSTHPLTGKELRLLRALQRKARTPFVFEASAAHR